MGYNNITPPKLGLSSILYLFRDIIFNMYMKKFAERLKELRLGKGLSIDNLSKLINVGHSSISRWENSQARINAEQLIVLAQFFGVSTDYLLGLED